MKTPNQLAAEVLDTCKAKGFYCPNAVTPYMDPSFDRASDNELMLGKLFLVLDELGECHDEMLFPSSAWRGEEQEIPPLSEEERFKRIHEELADVSIRLLHIAGACKIELPSLKVFAIVANLARQLPKPIPLWMIGKRVRNAGRCARHADQVGFDEWIVEALAFTIAVSESRGVNLWPIIEAKMETNRNRPAKHGSKSRL